MKLELNHLVPCPKNTNEYLNSFSLVQLNATINFSEKFSKLICVNELDDNDAVIYFKSLGYQERGMSKQFYKEFTNHTLYFKVADLEKAYKFLATDMQNKIHHLQKNFRDNFINNFTEGKSVFYVSW